MSQPPYDYAQYLGQAPQHSYPYATTPHIQPAASFYATPQEPGPTTVAGNYAAINGSFEYNANRIPGLGMSSTPATPLPPTPYRTEPTPSQTKPLAAGFPSPAIPAMPPKQDIRTLERSYNLNARAVPAPPAPAQSNEVSEEGELSDGEFEDLYEPRGAGGALEVGLKHQTLSSVANQNLAGSTGDADGSSIYDTGSTREEMVIDSTSASQPAADEDDDYEPGEYEPVYPPRDKTGSYSPQLSPKEARPIGSMTNMVTSQTKDSAQMPQSVPAFVSHGIGSKQATDRTDLPNGHASPTKNQPGPPTTTFNSIQTTSTTTLPYKSVSEAKKKAQEAILGLWPLKVRYQNYLDEGLDPQVVKSLFTELGLEVPKPPGSSQNHTLSATQAKEQPQTHLSPKLTSPAPISSTPPKPLSDNPPSDSNAKMEHKKSAQEERKDKIARMLAEKSKRNAVKPVSTVAPTAAPVSAPGPAISTAPESSDPAKVKLRAQNNQKILEKLAALKKQQEKKPESVEGAAAPGADSSKKQTNTTDDSIVVAQQAGARSSTGELDSSSTPGGPLGLSVSSSPHSTPKIRNMKRPIASDFDGYPPSGTALKRTRTQETLIIDVSDDEDVEMDLGSPTEPPSSAIQNTLPRTNSLAAFPPLSHSRNWRGHKSTSATPGAGAGAGAPAGHGQKLDLLTQQIQEARRKIAEAEAKKATAKKSNGVPTPLTQSPAHTPGPPESARLPKLSDVPRASKSERRDRIASYHLPVLDAALGEKQGRLQRLQAEAAQLELEVQATLDERQKLAVEMETLDVVTPGSFDTNSQNEPGSPVAGSPAQGNDAVTEAIAAQLESTGAASPAAAAAAPEQGTVLEPSPELSPDNTNMDIDSDSSSESGVSNTIVTAPPDVVDQRDSLAAPLTERDDPQIEAPVPEKSVQPPHGINQESTSPSTESALESSGPSPGVQPPIDADVPMQISDAEDEGGYEPVPLQISDADQTHVATGEDGEVKVVPQSRRALLNYEQVPDEEPYEPNPAQTSERHTHPAPDTTTGEARPQHTLSAQALLSYESPLRYFHAYKFHPQFKENVAGGLKSMTYSSKIDASRPICPYLLDDGQCPNGSSCDFQHFDKMTLSEPAIIAELGSTDTYTGEQKERFIDGLKKVLQNLKVNKIKDFDSITKALVQYRADFLGDRSKVLALNDVVI
ncbi:hypothetical protein AB5N19_12934 [Seiridium cardinale]